MYVAPFIVTEGHNQQNTPMGARYALLPDTHVLYFGPLECARHSFSGLVDDEHSSILVIDDLQTSMGATENLVAQAVEEITGERPGLGGFVLCTGCQTAFLGIDLDALCASLHTRTGLYFAHVEANRMDAGNIPGATRKNAPGGDRFHVCRSLFAQLAQREPDTKTDRGVLVLTEDTLDANCDLLDLTCLDGIRWARGIGDIDCFDMFLQSRDAALVIATSMVWKEAGEWMRQELGIPFLYLPTSYSLSEVADYYDRIDAALSGYGTPEQHALLLQKRADRKAHAETAVQRELERTTSLELDLRVVNRPFSLVETLMGYGFTVRDFRPAQQRVEHKEADDIDAFERLGTRYPAIAQQFAPHAKSRGKTEGSMLFRGQRGRFVEGPRPAQVQRVPEETAWWGYSSVEKLMAIIGQASTTPRTRAAGRGLS